MPDRTDSPAPVLAVGAIIPRGNRVLLIRRGKEPSAGLWTLPGGRVEPGETVRAALVREAREETGLTVTPGPLVEIFEIIQREPKGGLQYHFVILDFLAQAAAAAEAQAGSDAAALAWVAWDEVGAYATTAGLPGVLAKARTLIQLPKQSPLS